MIVEHWGEPNVLNATWTQMELVTRADWIGGVYAIGDRVFFEYTRLDGADLQSQYLPGSGDAEPHMAVLANGDIVVAWADGSEGADLDGRYQILTAVSHVERTGEETFAGSALDETPQAVAAYGDGFVAGYTTYGDAGGFDAWLKVVGETSPFQTAVRVHASAAGDQLLDDVTVLKGGRLLATWSDGPAAKGRIFEANGAAGAEFAITGFAPSVTALSNGGFVVASSSSDPANPDYSSTNVRAQVFSPTGQRVGDIDFVVNSTSEGGQDTPAIVALPDHGFVVFYNSNATDEVWGDQDVLGQRFDLRGNPLGPEFVVNLDRSGYQSIRDAVALADGRIAVAYATGPEGTPEQDGHVELQIVDLRDGYVPGTRDGDWMYGSLVVSDEMLGYGGVDRLFGMGGDDQIRGGAAGDDLYGGAGDDRLHGDAGADGLYGDAGDDTLRGGDHKDILVGGAGRDVLEGGAMRDVFRFATARDSGPALPDLIVDLDDDDIIDLSAIDANLNKAGNQAFSLVAAFTGRGGQAVLSYDGASTWLALDVNGDTLADSLIELQNNHLGFTHFAL